MFLFAVGYGCTDVVAWEMQSNYHGCMTQLVLKLIDMISLLSICSYRRREYLRGHVSWYVSHPTCKAFDLVLSAQILLIRMSDGVL
jgi:hypothetical protein